MPNSSALWMAAGLLWILDASINISMEPFRAFVADLLPHEQRTRGFAMQSLFIGLGAVMASAAALDADQLVRGGRPVRPGPFRDGALVVLHRRRGVHGGGVVDHRDYAREAARRSGEVSSGRRPGGGESRTAPGRSWMRSGRCRRRCGSWPGCRSVTWLGLFCMWLYFPVAVARNVFGAPDANSPLYQQGVEWAGICFGAYSAVCFAFSFFLPPLARMRGAKGTTRAVPAGGRRRAAFGGVDLRDPQRYCCCCR